MPKSTIPLIVVAFFLISCKASPTFSGPETPIPALTVASIQSPAFEQQTLLEWDFAADGKTLGWQPTHDLKSFSANGEGLHTFSDGGDPYMIGSSIEIKAAQVYYVEIQMRSTAGNDAQLFWITRQDSQYDEAKSQHFQTRGDGQWHTYHVPLSQNPAWKDTIIQLRLDPTVQQGSDITIGWIKMLGKKPGYLKVKTCSTAAAVVQAGQPFVLRAGIVNAGDTAVENVALKLALPAGLSLVQGHADFALDTLDSQEEAQITWQISGPAGVYDVALLQNDQILKQAFVIVADADAPVEVLENDPLRLTFARQPYGYGMATLYQGSKPLGRLRSLGALTYRAADETIHRVLLFAERAERVGNGLRLPFTFQDVDGLRWSGEGMFLPAPGGGFDIRMTLLADRKAQVVNWTGPAFYAGDGTSGAIKESALFPGIEFLLDHESSSGTDFFDPPGNLRYTPHPLQITVPLMAITHDGISVGLAWDPLQKWDGEQDRPGALFAAPNTWDGQDNHLMALFVQNSDNPAPYLLAAGRSLGLSARLFAIPAADALAPLAYWVETYGLPDLPPLPRTYERGIRLSLDSTMGPTWDETKKGWHYALQDPWGPGSSPANELHLWLAALRSDLAAGEQARYRTLARELSRRTDYTGGQPNPALYLPALYMHLADNDALLDMARLGRERQSGQNADGFWPFAPQPRSGRPFGQAGDTSSGQIAANALYLLRFARITGDPDLRQAGLRALAYMEAHHSRRPEGAQVWELPLHCPDILAAAWAEQCYLEAYWLTGEKHYAEQAQWWALSGLPFVYLWTAPDRPVMAYTTLPVFAATNYTYSWLGRPVMWNGLDYAFGLWSLNQVLDEAGVPAITDWQQVAEGIVRAAMQMQPESGAYLGMYPDAWDVVSDGESYSWWLHPFYILQNLYVMENAGAQVQTVILRDGSQPIHINAVARIERVERKDDQIEIDLSYYTGETCALVIGQLPRPPQRIALDGQPLPEIQSLEEEPFGWLYRDTMLAIKVPFAHRQATITIAESK